MQPVLETPSTDGFALWPVAERGTYGLMPLGGRLTPEEVGAAVMGVAEYNDVAAGPGRPADPLGSFVHGLLTAEIPQAPGGMRVVDDSGTVFLPGCCNGLEEWRDWYRVLDGDGGVSFGHDPDAYAERHGDTVRLTPDTSRNGGPVIEVPVPVLRRLLAGAERDLADFLGLVGDWRPACCPAMARRPWPPSRAPWAWRGGRRRPRASAADRSAVGRVPSTGASPSRARLSGATRPTRARLSGASPSGASPPGAWPSSARLSGARERGGCARTGRPEVRAADGYGLGRAQPGRLRSILLPVPTQGAIVYVCWA
ncbi:hypothetical protein SUDANB99_05781 [Streptomyces sp. enrichment culture]